MGKIGYFILVTQLCFSFSFCSAENIKPGEIEDFYLITSSGIGPIHIGMTLDEARKALPQAKFMRTSDGEGIALIDVRYGEKIFDASWFCLYNIDENQFKTEYKNKYELINQTLETCDIHIEDLNSIKLEQLADIFNRMIQVPNLIELLDSNMGLSAVQRGEADDQTIIKNKKKLAGMYPNTLELRESLMVLYADEDDPESPIDWQKQIEMITTYNSACHTKEGVHPGSLITQSEKIYGKAINVGISEIESRSYIGFDKQPEWLQFQMGYPLYYNFSKGIRNYLSPPFMSREISADQFVKEHKNQYKLIDQVLAEEMKIQNPSRISAQDIAHTFNRLISIPNLIELLDGNMTLSEEKEGEADEKTIIKNKKKLAEIYPNTLAYSFYYGEKYEIYAITVWDFFHIVPHELP